MKRVKIIAYLHEIRICLWHGQLIKAYNGIQFLIKELGSD